MNEIPGPWLHQWKKAEGNPAAYSNVVPLETRLHLHPEDEIQRFPKDSEGGPVIGFVPGRNDTVRIVTVEHDVATHDIFITERGKRTFPIDPPLQLLYTPDEWFAFSSGVKAGEFDYLQGHEIDLQDSKEFDGPILVISSTAVGPFFDAIKSGKYDLPPEQEASLAALSSDD